MGLQVPQIHNIRLNKSHLIKKDEKIIFIVLLFQWFLMFIMWTKIQNKISTLDFNTFIVEKEKELLSTCS